MCFCLSLVTVDYRPKVSTPSHGAYGFRFSGLDEALDWLNPAPSDWPQASVEQRVGVVTEPSPPQDDVMEKLLKGDRSLRVFPYERRVVLTGPKPMTNAALIHPYLAPAGAVLAWREDWPSLHSGAFVAGDEAWILAAERDGGKSTTLAALADLGRPILSDDVVILKDGKVAAGPRAIDLRAPSDFSDVEHVGVLGEREHWRKRLPPVSPEVPVAGLIQLVWSDTVSVRPIPLDERPELVQSRLAYPASGRSTLSILRLPMIRVSRPHGDLSETTALVLEAAGG